MSTAMHSTPIYQNFSEIKSTARSYLIVLEQEDLNVLQDIQANIDEAVPTKTMALSANSLDDLATLEQALIEYVATAQAGLHSVVYGSEVFLWQVHRILIQLGCLADEVSLIQSSTQTLKKVYCVHCGYLQETQAPEFCHCEQCKVHLHIRSHFSQRLGAYMGVCANAHQPMGFAS